MPAITDNRTLLATLTTKQLKLILAVAQAVTGGNVTPDTARATCPHCGHNGFVAKDFGTRVVRGTVYPQSWCRTCRAIPQHVRRGLMSR